jgi:hypothetical protein
MRVHPAFALVLLVATSTSTATAERHEERGGRVHLDSHGERHRTPRAEHDWIRLASPTPTTFGTEYIVVGHDIGLFRTLRVQAVSGSVYLRRIRVLSHDRFAKTIRVDRWLDRTHPIAYVDLGGLKELDQLAITTARLPIGVYTVYGSSGAVVPTREVAAAQ